MAFDVLKTDAQLGTEIETYLQSKGVQTPTNNEVWEQDTAKIARIAHHFEEIMLTLGLDLKDDSLKDTPKRVAKMFVNETCRGLQPQSFPKCTAVENKMHYDEMVVVRNITIQSVCEHHWQNISGKATIAYIPKDKVLGLSKFARVAEYFSRRPQIQERLTEQIFHALKFILATDDIAVFIDAEHSCMKARGVEETDSTTVTSKLGGRFKTDPAARAEFMGIVRGH